MKKVAIALGLAIAGAFACVTFRDSVEDKLPLTVIRALREPDSFEILALDPMSRQERGSAEKPIPSDKHFHGFEILGHAPFNEPVTRRELVELVLQGIQESDGTVAACFTPRHGIRAVKEGKVLDLVICYECLQVEIHFADLNEAGGRLGVLTSMSVEPEVTRLYQSAGLRISGK